MAQPGGAAQRQKKGGGLTWLLVGVVIGVLAAIFLPPLAGPYLPAGLRGEAVEVAGVVEGKSTEGERLLLTVASEAGATLVTFREDIAEINLLVGVGDSVLLAVDEYAPFVDDATIRRVMKQRDWRPAQGAGADTAAAGASGTDGELADTASAAADSARLGVDTSRARLDTASAPAGATDGAALPPPTEGTPAVPVP